MHPLFSTEDTDAMIARMSLGIEKRDEDTDDLIDRLQRRVVELDDDPSDIATRLSAQLTAHREEFALDRQVAALEFENIQLRLERTQLEGDDDGDDECAPLPNGLDSVLEEEEDERDGGDGVAVASDHGAAADGAAAAAADDAPPPVGSSEARFRDGGIDAVPPSQLSAPARRLARTDEFRCDDDDDDGAAEEAAEEAAAAEESDAEADYQAYLALPAWERDYLAARAERVIERRSARAPAAAASAPLTAAWLAELGALPVPAHVRAALGAWRALRATHLPRAIALYEQLAAHEAVDGADNSPAQLTAALAALGGRRHRHARSAGGGGGGGVGTITWKDVVLRWLFGGAAAELAARGGGGGGGDDRDDRDDRRRPTEGGLVDTGAPVLFWETAVATRRAVWALHDAASRVELYYNALVDGGAARRGASPAAVDAISEVFATLNGEFLGEVQCALSSRIEEEADRVCRVRRRLSSPRSEQRPS